MPIPEHVDEVFKYFDRYTKVMAPNGKPIHMVAEKGYSDKEFRAMELQRLFWWFVHGPRQLQERSRLA